MKVLVWQWGRRGAGPRVAAELARAFNLVSGTDAVLSLSAAAELLALPDRPVCALPIRTYASVPGFMGRVLLGPVLVPRLAAWLRQQRVDVAICAMPAPMDFVLATALRWAKIPYAVVVHDADSHPGDRFPMQIRLQRYLLRGASAVFALSTHVADRLRQQGLVEGKPLLFASLPPLIYGPIPPPPRAHGGNLRLLSFGRLLPYKGLDLLADSLEILQGEERSEVRIVGSGPESPELDRLRALPCVTVENRWVPEDEVSKLLAWSDALVLSHREASQSGVAATALAARRWVVATRVGGLEEQLRDEKLAVLCDPTPASIAEAIRTLRMRPELPCNVSDPRAAWAGVALSMLEGLREISARAARLVTPAQ